MSGIEAGKAFVKFLLEDKEFKKSLRNVGTQLKNVSKVGLTATAPLIASFTAAVATFVSVGDALGDMATRTGISAEALSELSYVTSQAGTSMASVEKAVKKMQVGLLDAERGSGALYESLGALGLSLANLQGLNPEEQFLAISRAIAAVEDPSRRAALAQKAFGKAGTELLPMLADGAEGIDKLRQNAHDLGVTMGDDDVQAAQELDDALNTAKKQVEAMAVQIGVAIAGPLTDFLNWSRSILAATIAWIKENPTLVATVAEVTLAIAGTSAALYAVGTALTIISAHPIIAWLGLLAGATVAVVKAWQWWADVCEDIANKLYGVEDAQYKLNKARAEGGLNDLATIQSQAADIQAQARASLAANPSPAGPAAAGLAAANGAVGKFSQQIAENTANTVARLDRLIQIATRGDAGFLAGTG